LIPLYHWCDDEDGDANGDDNDDAPHYQNSLQDDFESWLS